MDKIIKLNMFYNLDDAIEVDQLANVATILTVEEPTSHLVSTKRARDEEQQSPRGYASRKQTCVDEGDASGQVVAIVLTSNLSFIHNLLEGDKMEIAYDLGYNMFKVASNFSLVSIRRGEVLSFDSPFKERDTWKEKAEAMELKCNNLLCELITLQKEVEDANSLQETMKVH
ncbi:unnamed protein product [Vicia faba]|uniref:Uncharacterized protein n=1 Tax=Vicia faba TaxID=3906 RepID=A0AAV0YFQ0_VICFA|nr:unnamed protein product [Vicia faba]